MVFDRCEEWVGERGGEGSSERSGCTGGGAGGDHALPEHAGGSPGQTAGLEGAAAGARRGGQQVRATHAQGAVHVLRQPTPTIRLLWP